MKLVSLKNIKDNARVGKTIFSFDGRKLLAEDLCLRSSYIKNLLEWGITSVYIKNKKDGPVDVDGDLCKEVKTEIRQQIVKWLKRFTEEQLSYEQKESVQKTIEKLINDGVIVKNLAEIKALNDHTFERCISICSLSLITGSALGYSNEDLRQLGVGAILVDLGKTALPGKLLVNPGLLSSEERLELERHTQLGYDALSKIKRFQESAMVLLQHHECYDGSGYPQGLQRNQIHRFARIVSLSDMYVRLINDGLDGKHLMPHEVIEYIRDHGNVLFDPDITRVFLKQVTTFLVGTNVILNTGEKAKVITVHSDLLARPLVKVYFDKEGNKLKTPVEKNLEQDLTLFIVKALPDNEF